MPDELTRIVQSPRTSHSLLLGAASTAALAAVVIAKMAMTSECAVVIAIAVPQVVTPQRPPPIPRPTPPRYLAPFVSEQCVLGATEDPKQTCYWDRGFPAISRDGKTIAIERAADDGGRGNPGLTVELVDVASSRIQRTILVLDPEEYVPPDDESAPALRAKVRSRADEAQRVLEVGAYRALVPLGEGSTPTATGGGLRAELSGDGARVIDVASNAVIWQHRFSVESAFPDRKNDPEIEACEPSQLGHISLAWDAPTRTVLADVTYTAGPCFCPDNHVNYVQHVR